MPTRMGYNEYVIRQFVTKVDDTFYRRILTDPRVSFLAESFSPKIRVYEGKLWAKFWDLFLLGELTSQSFGARDDNDDDDGQPQPHTVLAALHRFHRHNQVVLLIFFRMACF